MKRPQNPALAPKTLICETFPPLETPNLAFRNRGDLTFEEVGKRWGFDSTGSRMGWPWRIWTMMATWMWW